MFPLSLIGSALKLVAKPLSKVLMALPKGTTTGTGGIISAVGLVTGAVAPHILTDVNLVPALEAVAHIITAIGGVVASFGLGRHEATAGVMAS